MTRWTEELEKLRDVHPRDDLWRQVEVGPRGAGAPQPRARQRIVAAVTAVAVFVVAIVVAWHTARPDLTAPVSNRGEAVPPFILHVRDRATAPPIESTTESYASGHSPHVLDLIYGSDVGRWRPNYVRSKPVPALEGGTTPYLYPDSDPLLNAGAPVQVSSDAAATTVSLIPIVNYPHRQIEDPLWKTTGPVIPLTDGGSLPGAGRYFLLVRVTAGDVVEEWRTNVYILAPGTLQLLWYNDGSGPHGEPEIAMAVNGEYLKCGPLDATGITGAHASPVPLPDAVPPQSQALTVAGGARIAFLESGFWPASMDASLSYANPTPPYAVLGDINFADRGQVLAVPPGEYLFRWHVEVHDVIRDSKKHEGFHGDLACPMKVTEPILD